MDQRQSERNVSDYTFLRKTMNHKILEREEEEKLAIAWRDHNDEAAMHQLIQSYMRLVVSVANRYRQYGVPMADMLQEGNLGLLQAVKRFDPHRGFRFSTYAKWWIRAFIQEYILRNWSIVRTGSTTAQKQLFFHLRRLKMQLLNIAHEGMVPEEQQHIAEVLNVSMRDVVDMEARLSQQDLSLSTPVSYTHDEEILSTLKDEGKSPEEVSVGDDVLVSQRHWIKNALDVLNTREQYIIKKRFLGEASITLDALGDELGITKERVRQIEARAIRKMRFKLMERMSEVRQTIISY